MNALHKLRKFHSPLENPERCPRLEENSKIVEMADVVILKNSNNTSFILEAKENTTLIPCLEKAKESLFLLSPENPEKFIVDKHVLYRVWVPFPRLLSHMGVVV